MAAFYDANGDLQQVDLSVTDYREAGEAKLSIGQYYAQKYPTAPERFGHTLNQLLASEGIFIKGDKEHGIRPSTMAEVLNGPKLSAGPNTNVRDSVPTSRILFPAAILAAVEDKMAVDLVTTDSAMNDMIGQEVSINGDRYEWPVLNFDNPEKARAQRIAQLAMPTSMMLITVSDTSRRITGVSMGLEVSDTALENTPMDFVAMSIARQAAVERNQKAVDDLLEVWNGDVDKGDASLASLGQVRTAQSYDSLITANSQITQKAWIKFMAQDSTKRMTSHVVTDLDTALRIEGRTGKPINTNDDPNSPRLDTLFSVMNPQWPGSAVKLFLVPEGTAWPANTIMSIDKRYSLRRVQSLTIGYSAIENYVMRRSTAMRFDYGSEVHRLFSDATNGMTLTV